MKIIKDLSEKKIYKFIHSHCCEFTAEENEFKWTTGRYQESMADIICPKCGKQFYSTEWEVIKK